MARPSPSPITRFSAKTLIPWIWFTPVSTRFVATVRPLDTGPASGSTALHPATLYADAARGVVDITARSRSTIVNPFGPAESESVSSRSGVVLDGRGAILIADHVVQRASSISMTFSGGATRGSQVLGRDPASDLAVLHVDPSGLTLHPLRLGDSGALQVGDPVAAIGDPFGYRRSMSPASSPGSIARSKR